METSSYHLWLKPSGEAHATLFETIRALARRYRAPIFEPHVTLLSPLAGSERDHLSGVEQLARRLERFLITLTTPSYGDEYFRCVFMMVEQAPPIMEAHRRARHIFKRHDDAPYMPHVSLLYGMYPAEFKRQVIAALSPALRMSFDVAAIYLIKADSDDPKDWHERAAVQLGGTLPGDRGSEKTVANRGED